MSERRPANRFEIFTDQTMRGMRYFWRLVAGTNDVLAVSREYNARSSAIRAAKNLKDVAVNAKIEEAST